MHEKVLCLISRNQKNKSFSIKKGKHIMVPYRWSKSSKTWLNVERRLRQVYCYVFFFDHPFRRYFLPRRLMFDFDFQLHFLLFHHHLLGSLSLSLTVFWWSLWCLLFAFSGKFQLKLLFEEGTFLFKLFHYHFRCGKLYFKSIWGSSDRVPLLNY